ncbi:hypothetical protein [Oscillatoria sp. FACHB-1407]|nr:hypothetical protein [Oscillatoria sp. FACHB-1407]
MDCGALRCANDTLRDRLAPLQDCGALRCANDTLRDRLAPLQVRA